jgi:glyoxylase-like metal-dependent hydrolase (beta-lactamase superfamily II)
MMRVRTLALGTLQTNCYLIEGREKGVGAIIDPGAEPGRVLQAARGLEIQYVVNTHAHFDHTMANGAVLEGLRAQQDSLPKLISHPKAASLLAAGGGAALFGFHPVDSPQPDRLVGDGDILSVDCLTFQILHTPGHSPGSISLYNAEDGVVFVGDVLFWRGVGRPDLPGGSWPVLLDSIQSRLLTLPDETQVYAGHGPPTTIGDERSGNPYLR